MAYELNLSARSRGLLPRFGELYAYREVLQLLVWRDLKVRYKQTLLGVLWVVLQPLIATLIFAVIFSRFARFESGETPYVLVALSGFTFWMFVNPAVTQAASSLVYHEQLVTKIYFPRLIVPSAAVFAGLPDLLLTIPVFLAVLFYMGFGLAVSVLFLPLAVLWIFAVALGFGVLFGALNVRFRDVKFVIPFVLQVWMFVSPVFYPSEWLPDGARPFFAVNPLSGGLDLARHALLGSPLNELNIIISLSSAMGVCFVALIVFRRLEDDFADQL